MTIYTTRDTATQASLGRLRELVLVWVLVGARALLHLLLASPLLVAVSPFTAACSCRASCAVHGCLLLPCLLRRLRRRRSPRPGPAVVVIIAAVVTPARGPPSSSSSPPS